MIQDFSCESILQMSRLRLRQAKSLAHSNHNQGGAETQMVSLSHTLVVEPKAGPECWGGDETLQKAKPSGMVSSTTDSRRHHSGLIQPALGEDAQIHNVLEWLGSAATSTLPGPR